MKIKIYKQNSFYKIDILENISIEISENEFLELCKVFNSIRTLKINEKVENHNICDFTLKKAFDEYIKEKDVKQSTTYLYAQRLKHIFLSVGDDWQSIKISEILSDVYIEKLKKNAVKNYQYWFWLSILFKWLLRKDYIDKDPITKILYNLKKNTPTKRKALHCEDWISIEDGEKSITNFFGVFKSRELHISQKNYYLLVLHFILGTRIQETIQYVKTVTNVFKQYSELTLLSNVEISTKTTKKWEQPNFRMPVPDFIYVLIQDICTLGNSIPNYSMKRYLAYVVSHCNDFSLHGTRSIFRTIIDFITVNENVSDNAKELYLNHSIGSKVQKIYHRNDYFIDRIKLMCIYADFIFKCSGLDDYRKLVKNYVERFNASSANNKINTIMD